MDTILFYGQDQDRELTRKRVRSAAAQHSHRIGPRKAKSSKKDGRSERGGVATVQQKRKTLHKKQTSALALVAQQQRTAHAGQPHAATQSAPHETTTPRTTGIDASLSPSPADRQLKSPDAQESWEQVQAIQRQTAFTHREGQLRLPPIFAGPGSASQTSPAGQAQNPLPPLNIPGIDILKQAIHSHSRHDSTTTTGSPASSSTTLPQYSWTEYPRYGLSLSGICTSLDMLAHLTSEEGEAYNKRYATSNAHYVPGFRQYEREGRLSSGAADPISRQTQHVTVPLLPAEPGLAGFPGGESASASASGFSPRRGVETATEPRGQTRPELSPAGS